MKQKIISAIANSSKPLALITAYEVSGSSPCQIGAMLALFDDGSTLGTVGGGAVEAKALELAQECLLQKTSDILTVDMLGKNPNDAEMICGGSVKFWIEYLDDFTNFKQIACILETGNMAVRIGEIKACGKTISVINNNEKIPDLNPIEESFFDKENDLFYHLIAPLEKLLILGGGYVGKAIADYAVSLGFEITIADSRDEFINPNRYHSSINCLKGNLAEIIANFNLGQTSYVVVVSPSHLTDLECAKALMTKEYCYAGLMGSRRKVKMIFEELKKLGFSDNKIESLNAPIGLDIGAVTPEEIALAILAEIVAVKRKSNNLEAFFKMNQIKLQKV